MHSKFYFLITFLTLTLAKNATINIYLWNDLVRYTGFAQPIPPSQGSCAAADINDVTDTPKKNALLNLTDTVSRIYCQNTRSGETLDQGFTYLFGLGNSSTIAQKIRANLSVKVHIEEDKRKIWTYSIDQIPKFAFTNIPVMSVQTWTKATAETGVCSMTDDDWKIDDPIGNYDISVVNFCVMSYMRTGIKSQDFKLLNDIATPDYVNSTWNAIKTCLFTNSSLLDVSIVQDSFDDTYSSFSDIKNWTTQWQRPPMTYAEAKGMLWNLSKPWNWAQIPCKDFDNSSRIGVAFFCPGYSMASSTCENFYTTEGTYLFGGVAVKSSLDGLWCLKVGYGPKICFPSLDEFQNGCINPTQSYLLGSAGLCYYQKNSTASIEDQIMFKEEEDKVLEFLEGL